jgi:protein-disulfide isomerase
MNELDAAFPGQVRRVWRHFPLMMHAGADRTHAASECAHQQGKFWEMHEKIFAANRMQWDDAAYGAFAREAGADEKKFLECLDGTAAAEQVLKDVEKGNASGVRGTPAIFINGRLYGGAIPFSQLERIVRDEIARKKI